MSALGQILRTDPQRYLQIINDWIAENPNNSHAYFDRHFFWMKLGDPQQALKDLNKAIELEPEPVTLIMRGEVHRSLGEYENAVVDYARAEALDPDE